MIYRFSIFIIVAYLFCSCGQQTRALPYGYYRIELPENSYQQVDTIFPYTFDKSIYSQLFPRKENEKQWLDIKYPKWNANIHCSYKRITQKEFASIAEDAHTLAYKHTVKADAIKESYFENRTNNVYGIMYEIGGDVASSIQFFVTDSTKNFLRGSLYFNNIPNSDSIAPVHAFIQKDILKMIETLKWKD